MSNQPLPPVSQSINLSVTIIVLNEERNLPRCLAALKNWADEIIVVDSGSTDNTQHIARQFGAVVHDLPWRGYGAQKNLAMDFCSGQWVFNIDADEIVTPELKTEITEIIKNYQKNPNAIVGYRVARKTYFGRQWIRYGGWYPNYVMRLCVRTLGRWSEPNVHEELEINGKTGFLQHPLEHYTFQSVKQQVQTNVRYALQGAKNLKESGCSPSLLKTVFKPIGKFIECYFLKRGFLDGYLGFVIAVNAAHSMFLKFVFLKELCSSSVENEKSH